MEKKKENQEILLGVASHVLGFTVTEFCKYGYLLAFERELFDLKGLVQADSIYENDFEILEGLDDQAIKLLLNSVDKVVKHTRVFLMINGLDEMEVMTDKESHQHASNNFHYYINEGVGKTYPEILLETHDLYFSVMHLVFHTACQLRLNVIDLPDALFDTFYFDFLDVLDGNLVAEDKNIQVLYDLIVDLNEDALALAQLT